MEPGPGLSPAEIEVLFQEAADPAVAFLYDDKVRAALVAQVCELTGCPPVAAHLGLWAAQQAAAGIAASGVQWLGGTLATSAAKLLLLCPGCDRLAEGLRRLFRRAREEAAFRAEIDAIARGERDPNSVVPGPDAPDDVKLAVRLLQEVTSLASYLPGEFDDLHGRFDALQQLLQRPAPLARPLPPAPSARPAVRSRLIRVFISYAHADREAVERLATHIRWLEHDQRIAIFDDSKLTGGEKWESRLIEELAKADIVLLVVTADFTASHYCTQVELKEALKRCETDGICLIPILAAPCDWEAMPITDRQALPKDAKLRLKPLSRWGVAKEEAFTQIAKHVRRRVEAIAATLAETNQGASEQKNHLKQSSSPSDARRLSRSVLEESGAVSSYFPQSVSINTISASLQTEISISSHTAATDVNFVQQFRDIQDRKLRAQRDFLENIVRIQEEEIRLYRTIIHPQSKGK